MVEARALYAFGLDEIEDLMQVNTVAACKCEAQANLLTCGLTVADAAHRRIERAFLAAEQIICLSNAIERNANVGRADLLQTYGRRLVDERAVRGECDAQAFAGRMLHQIKCVWSRERFAAREQQCRHIVRREVVDVVERLLVRQLSRVLQREAVRVTMNATQVARTGDVPDDDWFAFGSRLGRPVAVAVAQVVGRLLLTAIEFRDVDHETFSAVRTRNRVLRPCSY